MSVCACGWDCYTLGSCILGGGPRVAKKAGHVCCNCGGPVEPGQRCVDFAGLYGDDYGEFFYRMHEECYRLMKLFAERFCGGEWAVPFNLTEAAAHAVSEGDDPFWRNWLLLYEKTWGFSPEPPDPKTRRVFKAVPVKGVPFVEDEGRVVARVTWVLEEVE